MLEFKIALLALASIYIAGTAFAGTSIDIGSRLEPLVDDYIIAKMDGAELRLQHPVAKENVFEFNAPWEGTTSAYVTVFQDNDRFRMYYRGSGSDPKQPQVTCTAESSDGIHWVRPKLGIFEYEGSKENNIVWMGIGTHAFVPFKDLNPKAKPDELYKAVTPMPFSGKTALFPFVSSDGYHWKQFRKEPVTAEGLFDSQNLAFWDSERKEYVCYFRDIVDGLRIIKRCTSKDFITWGKAEFITYTGAPTEQLYTNAIQPYFRAPHIYMGFPKRFMLTRKAVESHPIEGISDGVFMTSREGLSFHRWEEAFMRPGFDIENWTDRNVMAAWGMLELRPGEISMYYSQHYRHPSSHLVRVVLRTDGFVSVHAGGKDGEMITKPLVFSGKELILNYSTSAAGGINVEIQDEDGKPLSGFALTDCPTIYGDELERAVRWSGGSDLSTLSRKPVILRFQLKDADLYSIQFRP